MIYSLRVSKSYGSTAKAASLGSLDSTVVYAAGAGVALVTFPQQFSFQVCAPKQLKEGTAPQLGSMNTDSKASLRLNSISCVALAQEFVAVGETGHCPRVVIFSRTGDRILATMQEHQFGVNLMQFSPSGHLLATLGTPQDGYLYVWKTTPKVSVAVSNRCISEVSALCWLSESTLVTAGVRHLRVWTVSEGTTVLGGRNVVLGENANSRFTALLSIGDGDFLVGNESGQVFKVSNGVLETLIQTGEHVHSLVLEGDDSYIAATPTKMVRFNSASAETRASPLACQALVATGAEGLDLVCLEDSAVTTLGGESLSGPAFTGISKTSDGFIAWNDSKVSVFASTTQLVREEPIEQLEDPHAHLTYAIVTANDEMACAYENGTVRIGSSIFVAHGIEGAPITLSQGAGWILSAGRDSLQIYTKREDSWEQWQTLSMHGRVTRARVVDESTLVATVTNKVINILCADAESTFAVAKSIATTSLIQNIGVSSGKLWVSTLDKKLTSYDLSTGQLEETFTTCDMLGEPIVLTNLSFIVCDERACIVASANDKSIVMYDERSGELLACQWAHGESPNSVLVVDERYIVSAARDGLFIYTPTQLPQQPVSRPASPVRVMRGSSPTRAASPTRQLRSSGSVGNLRPKAASPERAVRTAQSPPRVLQRSPRKTQDALKLAPPPFKLEAQKSPSPPPTTSVPSLSHQLRQYIESGTSDPTLFPLLVKALEKSDEKRALKYYSKHLAEYFE